MGREPGDFITCVKVYYIGMDFACGGGNWITAHAHNIPKSLCIQVKGFGFTRSSGCV